MDFTMHRISAVWKSRGNPAGCDFHTGMSDNLCWSDYFNFTVLFNTVEESIVSYMGICDCGVLISDLQSWIESDSEYFYSDSECDLSSIHHVDSAWII